MSIRLMVAIAACKICRVVLRLFGQPVTDKVWKEIREMHEKSAHKRIGAINYR